MSKWQIFGWTTPFSVKKCAQSFTDLAPFALRPAPVRDQSPRRLLASCHTQRAARSALARSPGRSFDSSWRIRPSAAITPPHKSIRTLSCRVPLLRLTAQLHHSTGAPPCTKTAADLEVPFAFKFPTRIFVFFTSKKFNFLSVWIESYCFFIYIYICIFVSLCVIPEPCFLAYAIFSVSATLQKRLSLSLCSMKTLNPSCATNQLFVTFFL